jgi:phage tail-like protein
MRSVSILPADVSVDPSEFAFRARTNPLGPAIDLVWELPPTQDETGDLQVLILRREGRFPGRTRRGVVAVDASLADLGDGVVVHDSARFDFDLEESREETDGGRPVVTTRQFHYRGAPPDLTLVRTIRRDLGVPGAAPGRTTFRVIDRGSPAAPLADGTTYYYTALFGPSRTFSRRTQGSATATAAGRHRLFAQLPRIDQRRDETLPPSRSVARADEGRGQLDRFLATVDAHADMLLGFVEGLRNLRATRRIDARLLPSLAALIGWRLTDTLDEEQQRNEIAFAPDVYRTVGTAPNVAATVNRLTGWDTRVKEFARQVVLSFDASRVEAIQSGRAYFDGSAGTTPDPPHALVTRTAPAGSVDTTDALAMFRLRNRAFEDRTAYSYDAGRLAPDGRYALDNAVLYNRETIGVYVVPDVVSETLVIEQEWDRVRAILGEFLPIAARAVVVVLPDVIVEDAFALPAEELVQSVQLLQDEQYGEGADAVADRIPEWRTIVANNASTRSVNTAATPVDVNARTRHTAVEAGPAIQRRDS